MSTPVVKNLISDESTQQWWSDAVVYQIYPRSFSDANGDGVGDLNGILSKIDYLDDLGVDAIWLSPFYPSPLKDGGYDVADYRDVDSVIGTIQEFDKLVSAAHKRNIKIIIDIVPNHTSNQHPWFKEALNSEPGSAARNRYVFRKGKGKDFGTPPTNWLSNFGGSAWQPCGDGWYYLHLFSKEQPDLNWDNPEVREEFLSILKFWSDKGVDGFRIDVSHALAKDLKDPLRDRLHPEIEVPEATDGSDPLWDRNEVHEIYRGWRKVFNQYNPPRFAVGETWSPFSDRVFQYARKDELGSVFDFSLLKTAWGREQYREVINRTYASARSVESAPTWVLSNHDVPRVASRLGLPEGIRVEDWVTSNGTNPQIDEVSAAKRARSAAMMILFLPGTAFLYQGEELGLPEDVELKPDEIQDPLWEDSGHKNKGRDGARVPLPWSMASSSFGFNTTGKSWLPQPAWWGKFSVAVERNDSNSFLSLYRAAIALRKEVLAKSSYSYKWGSENDTRILHLIRGSIHMIINFSQEDVALPENARILLISDTPSTQKIKIVRPECAVWFRA